MSSVIFIKDDEGLVEHMVITQKITGVSIFRDRDERQYTKLQVVTDDLIFELEFRSSQKCEEEYLRVQTVVNEFHK
jgi:hypothetical protein